MNVFEFLYFYFKWVEHFQTSQTKMFVMSSHTQRNVCVCVFKGLKGLYSVWIWCRFSHKCDLCRISNTSIMRRHFGYAHLILSDGKSHRNHLLGFSWTFSSFSYLNRASKNAIAIKHIDVAGICLKCPCDVTIDVQCGFQNDWCKSNDDHW